MDGLGEEWHPGRCGVWIRRGEDSGLILQPLRDPLDTLTTDDVLHLVAGFIYQAVPVFLSMPTKPGYCPSLVHLNVPLQQAVQSRDIVAARLAMLRAVQAGLSAKTDPVVPLSP